MNSSPRSLLLAHVLIKNDRNNLLHFLKNEIPELEIILLFDREPEGALPGYFTPGVKGCLMKDEEKVTRCTSNATKHSRNMMRKTE